MTNAPTFSGLTSTSDIAVTGISSRITTSGANGNIEATGGGSIVSELGTIQTNGPSGIIATSGDDASISTSGEDAHIYTNGNGSYIQTSHTFNLSNGTHVTTLSHAPTANRAIVFPDAAGTIALNETISGGTLAGSFTTLAASGVTSVTDTTEATSTTAASLKTAGGLGVAKNIYAGGVINIPDTTSSVGQILQNGTQFIHTYGTDNLFLGSSGNPTLASMSGSGLNLAVGKGALAAATTTSGNMAIGKGALGAITTSANYNNVAIGNQCMDLTTTAVESIAIGTNCNRSLAVNSATVIGVSAKCGSYSVSIGHGSMNSTIADAVACVAVGRNCMSSATGERNTAVGHQAGTTITTGTYNSLFGEAAQTGSATATYRTAIGAGATGTANNQVMLGRASDAVVVPGTLAVGGGTVVAKLRHGNATLVSGTVTVTDTAITANSRIWINRFTDGGTLGDSYSITRSAGASFTITSKTANVTASLDTSVVTYFIIEP
jgi:hypothetical protein